MTELTRELFLERSDHSILRPTATLQEYTDGLEFAAEVNVGAVCVSPHRLGLARRILQGTGITLATVVGFPSGCHATEAKVAEARQCIADGATGLDMVMDIGAMLSGEDAMVQDDIAAVVRAAEEVPVKVILEVYYLSDDQIARACALATDAGVAYVKTATGFAPGGATPHNVALLRSSAGAHVKVKASGGISSLADVRAVYAAGADRWGISRTREILAEF